VARVESPLPSLARLGIEHPRLAGQILVNVNANAQFRATGMAQLNATYPFSVTGRYTDKKQTPVLEVSIRATQQMARGPEDMCNIQTEISAPPGHAVVLGVVPIGPVTSVFVVQVLTKDLKATASPNK